MLTEFLFNKSLGSYSPMMAVGYFVFNLHTIPYQNQQHHITWRHPTNSRVGARPSSQFIGPGDETMTLSGTLVPEITGGRVSLDLLRKMADTGKAYPLIDGSGQYYGIFTIEDMTTTKTEFFSDGAARKIEFSVQLKRKDDSDRVILGLLNISDLNLGGLLGGLL